MSVINQMLRDLDQRGKTPELPAQGQALHQGTHSVPPPAQPVRATASRRRSAPWLAGVAASAVATMLAAWYLGYLALPGLPPPHFDAVSTVPTVSSMVGAPAPAQAASEAASPVATVASANTSTAVAADLPVSLRLEDQLEHVPTSAAVDPAPAALPLAKPKPAPAPVRTEPPAPKPQPALVPMPVAKADKAAPGMAAPAATAPASVPAPAAPEAAQLAQRQAAAARDALAQAQSLWSAGNPGAATELLREAVQVVLRTVPGTAALDSTQVAMVRELARMQMGSGHVAEAHSLLVQNEARFKTNAELWAMRANAAQRLGQHQDSVQSYMQALQYRPNEQRWLLGLAVSLAAMGQTAAANGVVERARNEGAIPREIADYLRQMGVLVK